MARLLAAAILLLSLAATSLAVPVTDQQNTAILQALQEVVAEQKFAKFQTCVKECLQGALGGGEEEAQEEGWFSSIANGIKKGFNYAAPYLKGCAKQVLNSDCMNGSTAEEKALEQFVHFHFGKK